MGAVISLLNQKGGVGKTSSCHHLAGALSAMGKAVLLVDNDPQASLTQGFFGPEAMCPLGPASRPRCTTRIMPRSPAIR